MIKKNSKTLFNGIKKRAKPPKTSQNQPKRAKIT